MVEITSLSCLASIARKEPVWSLDMAFFIFKLTENRNYNCADKTQKGTK